MSVHMLMNETFNYYFWIKHHIQEEVFHGNSVCVRIVMVSFTHTVPQKMICIHITNKKKQKL